jgi:hypothetical protein
VETATILLADLGVSINDDDNDNDFAVYFDRLGIPYDSYVNEDDNNPITSDNPMSITISAGTESQTLNVTPQTGFITTQ